MDGNGFQSLTARAAITQDNQWNQMTLGGYQNFLGVSNIATNAYHGHILLTRPGQILNFSDRILVNNNNRDHTLTLGGEHQDGTAYIGSTDNSEAYRIFFQNSNSERDLRFLQVRGGTLVVNARLEDGNTTADSFNCADLHGRAGHGRLQPQHAVGPTRRSTAGTSWPARRCGTSMTGTSQFCPDSGLGQRDRRRRRAGVAARWCWPGAEGTTLPARRPWGAVFGCSAVRERRSRPVRTRP
jgi:hypothetical protein